MNHNRQYTAIVLVLTSLWAAAAEIPQSAPVKLPYDRTCPVIYERLWNDYVD